MSVVRPGVFDVLHVGHVRCIRQASEVAVKNGLPLIVAVHDDRDVLLEKGRSPVIPLRDRMELLSEIRGVDDVISYRNRDLSNLLRKIDTKFLCVNPDYGTDAYSGQEDQLRTLAYCDANNVSVIRTPVSEGVSSTVIRTRLASREFWSKPERVSQTMLTSFQSNAVLQSIETEREVNLMWPHCIGQAVVDLGCGDGRLTVPLSLCCSIAGLDCSADLIQAAISRQSTAIFHFLDISSNTRGHLNCDVLVMSGLLSCLDDSEVHALLAKASAVSRISKILVRVSVASDKAFSVIRQFSDDLDDFYTAHYRTATEYIDVFRAHGWQGSNPELLYANHSDSSVIYVVFTRNS